MAVVQLIFSGIIFSWSRKSLRVSKLFTPIQTLLLSVSLIELCGLGDFSRRQVAYFTSFTSLGMTLPALLSSPCQKSLMVSLVTCLMYFWARSPFVGGGQWFTIPKWIEISLQLTFTLGVSLVICRNTSR